MKRAFCKEPILQHFDICKPKRVGTDVSRKAIGDILCQQNTDNNWYPIAYYLCKMAPSEWIYETHNAELLAIV